MSTDIYNTNPENIVMYSAPWCPDCKRAKKFFEEHHIRYLDVDIGKDNEAFLFVEKLTRRVRIPTIVFPGGTLLIEPSVAELERKLGI